MMKMKHIIALCLVLALVLPSTALGATSASHPAKVSITVVNHGSKTVTAYYSLTGAKEVGHTWKFGDGFSCHCKHRTHTYKKHGTYKVSISLKTTSGKTLTASKLVKV
jgi:PKD repeat protein